LPAAQYPWTKKVFHPAAKAHQHIALLTVDNLYCQESHESWVHMTPLCFWSPQL
jgi:hypothetical protein